VSAPKGNQYAKGNKGGGRPTKYSPKQIKQVEMAVKIGCTDAEIADLLNIGITQLNEWKHKHKEFSAALKGKELADVSVKRSLFERAIGYAAKDTYFSSYEGKVTATPTIKHFPPDVTACIFWLKNRQPDKWRDKSELAVTNTVLGLPEDKLEILRKLADRCARNGHAPELVHNGNGRH